MVKYIRYYFGYMYLDTDRINKDVMGYLRLSQLDVFSWLYRNIITFRLHFVECTGTFLRPPFQRIQTNCALGQNERRLSRIQTNCSSCNRSVCFSRKSVSYYRITATAMNDLTVVIDVGQHRYGNERLDGVLQRRN